MSKSKNLTKKQLAVIDDLFSGELDEQTALDKHKVGRDQFYKWLADEQFTRELDNRIAGFYRQSAALIAKYAPLAAAKLVQLTESQNSETARKACLDIISLTAQTSNSRPPTPDPTPPTFALPLSPATASRLLSALAQENRNEND